MKYLKNILIFIGLLFLYIVYSTIIISLLEEFGLHIENLSILFQSIIYIIIDISLIIIFYLIYRKELNIEFKNYRKNFKKYFITSLKCWGIGLLLMLVSNIIIQSIYSKIPINEASIQEMLKKMPIYIAFSSCVMAPFIEELIFRKSLGKIFNSNILFIIWSGLLFGLIHNINSFETGQLLYIIPYGAFGAVFAYLYKKTDNIFSSITIHCLHNTILVILSLVTSGVI